VIRKVLAATIEDNVLRADKQPLTADHVNASKTTLMNLSHRVYNSKTSRPPNFYNALDKIKYFGLKTLPPLNRLVLGQHSSSTYPKPLYIPSALSLQVKTVSILFSSFTFLAIFSFRDMRCFPNPKPRVEGLRWIS
jgi:hypothetical protein